MKLCLRALSAATLASALGLQAAVADTGSAAFDRYVQDLRQRLQAAENGSGWISTQVDAGAFERYTATLGAGAGGPGMTDTAIFLASANAQPLRDFNTYLAYLGMRMRVDAGPPGALLEQNQGTGDFDRYIEDINYRIQAMYRAEVEGSF